MWVFKVYSEALHRPHLEEVAESWEDIAEEEAEGTASASVVEPHPFLFRGVDLFRGWLPSAKSIVGKIILHLTTANLRPKINQSIFRDIWFFLWFFWMLSTIWLPFRTQNPTIQSNHLRNNFFWKSVKKFKWICGYFGLFSWNFIIFIVALGILLSGKHFCEGNAWCCNHQLFLCVFAGLFWKMGGL